MTEGRYRLIVSTASPYAIDGTYRGETTTLAYDLESRHKERSVIPDDKAVAFVCDLLEDLADEWAVKLSRVGSGR